MARTYVVVQGTSVRRSADPASPLFREWTHYRAGDEVSRWPKHADVAGWLASGHWRKADEESR